MAPQKRKAETYDKSDHFVDDDDEIAPGPGPSSKRVKASTLNSHIPIPEMKKDDEGNEFWEISKARRVGLSDYKGKRMVSIREYYEKDSKWLPGKKGITMTLEQFSALVTVLPQIEMSLVAKGEEIPRPRYDGGPVGANEDDGGEDNESEEEDEKKANFDATSDEDEG